MSSFVLDDINFKYFKKEITRLLMTESHIRYNLEPLKALGKFDDDTLYDYINKQVDYLQEVNVKSVYYQYHDERMQEYNKQPMPEKRNYYQGDTLTEHDTLQLINNLKCLSYQIESPFNDYFLKTILFYAMEHLTQILIEKNHALYDYNDREYIQWGF